MRARLAILLGVVLLAAALAGSAGSGSAQRPTRPLVTAVVDAAAFKSAESAAAFTNARRAGATVVRLMLDWSVVAPQGAAPPEGFVPTRPDDPRYDWASFDRQVREATSLGLAPIADIVGAPAWAQGTPPGHRRAQDGPYRPKHAALGAFARAAAVRYSGVFGDLPRVRYWMVWNEPNFSWYLSPQQVEGRLVSPEWYRAMVNAVAASVKAVRRDNLVVAGGLAPYGTTQATLDATSPLLFMRRMLCLSDGKRPKRTCAKRTSFDIWSHHPYTSGGPTREAGRRDDVSLGDLDEMAAVLRTAQRAGTIRSSAPVRFWVTEFSWDTAPPDPKGVPTALHARWVAEALYRMWRDGVSLVTWFLVRDEPFPEVSTQSGLFYRGASGPASDTVKPSTQAFRFPFVALRQTRRRVLYWGRTPTSAAATVVVERSVAGGWKRVARVRAGSTGVFTGTFTDTRRTGSVRARIAGGGERAIPFSLRVPRDREVCPFGSC